MSESNLEEDNFNYEDNESVSKSYGSKQKKKEANNMNVSAFDTGSKKKKARRSRIIISEPNESSNDYKKEIYDPETKYKKAIISAIGFNEYINSSRRGISKHFLKRKVKAAFEREPIEKSKGFNFNVPFIPNMSMFTTPQTNTQAPQGNLQAPRSHPGPQSSHTLQSSNKHSSHSSAHPNASSDTDKTVIISLNPNRSEQKSASQGRNLFNVNQTAPDANNSKNQINSQNMSKMEIKIDSSKEVRMDHKSSKEFNNSNLGGISKISSQNSGNSNNFVSINSNTNQNLQLTPTTLNTQGNEKGQKNLSNNITGNMTTSSNSGSGLTVNITNPNSQANLEMIKHQQQIRFKAFYELYRRDPEKLKSEIGSSEFLKFQNVVKSLQQRKEAQNNSLNNPNNQTGTQTTSNNQNITVNSPVQNNFQLAQSPNLNLQLLQNMSNTKNMGININPNIIQNFQKQMLNSRVNPSDNHPDQPETEPNK